MNVSKTTSAKIGLLGAACIVISAVVGMGIFFKNSSVFKNNNGNALGIMLSWIIAASTALFTAFSFAEIVTCKGLENQNEGLGGWAKSLCGNPLGRSIKILQPSFYYIIKVLAMSMFSAAAMFQIYFAEQHNSNWFGHNSILVIMLVGIGLISLFVFLNYVSLKICTGISKFDVYVKFFPLIIIVLIGIIFGVKYGGGLWVKDYSHVDASGTPGAFDINGVFRSIPAILFAFDSFLIIGNVSTKINNPEKNVSLSIVISMCVAASIEMLVTISEITIGTGDPYQVLFVAFGKNEGLYRACSIILSIFIVISALGALNSLTLCGMRAMQASIEEDILCWSKLIKKHVWNTDELKYGMISFSIFEFIFFLVIFIPSVVLNTDQIFDGASNLAILFFFVIYGTVSLAGLINRKTKKVEVIKSKIFIPCSIISFLGCYFAFFYCAVYQFIVNIALHPDLTTSNSWGLGFLKLARSTNLLNWECAIVFWIAAGAFISFPFINDLIIKFTDKDYDRPLVWQKTRKVVTTIQSVN